VSNFTAVDWLILMLYCGFVLGIGRALKPHMKTGKDFLQAGRSLPAWICGLAFLGAGMGAEVIAMGAAGARYGLESAQFFGIGAIPAMIFAGLFMMPLYYGSKARSVPEFLGMRFDGKTRALNAGLFLLMTVFSSGILMVAMARVIQALHLFDGLFRRLGWAPEGIFSASIVFTAAIVLAYVLLGGLASAMYNQALQFFLLVAGFLPMVILGLRTVGGWSGLKAALPAANLHEWSGVTRAGANPMGLIVGLGLVLGASYWCTDFRVIQTAMAAKDVNSARRAPLLAAILCVFLPFLLILPGMLAIALPTPHTTTVERIENGAIFRTTTVVRPEAEAGSGIVPARMTPAGKPILTASGGTLLDYDMATPNMLLRFLPTGLLGLGLTALLASLMSGIAAGATAFNTVITCDFFEAHIRKNASEQQTLAVGRWATAAAILLPAGAACAISRSLSFDNVIATLLMILCVVNVPLLATILLGMFWKRTTGHGAFYGLIAGTSAALLHHGLTLPIEAQAGIHGGWIRVLHTYPSEMAQCFWTAIFAFMAALAVTVAVSFCTRARPEAELVGLVRSLTPKPKRERVWWKRPETLAVAILLVAVALNLLFA